MLELLGDNVLSLAFPEPVQSSEPVVLWPFDAILLVPVLEREGSGGGEARGFRLGS